MTPWNKDRIVAAFRSGKKPVVFKWPDGTFRDMRRTDCIRIMGDAMVEELAGEIIIHAPRLTPK